MYLFYMNNDGSQTEVNVILNGINAAGAQNGSYSTFVLSAVPATAVALLGARFALTGGVAPVYFSATMLTMTLFTAGTSTSNTYCPNGIFQIIRPQSLNAIDSTSPCPTKIALLGGSVLCSNVTSLLNAAGESIYHEGPAYTNMSAVHGCDFSNMGALVGATSRPFISGDYAAVNTSSNLRDFAVDSGPATYEPANRVTEAVIVVRAPGTTPVTWRTLYNMDLLFNTNNPVYAPRYVAFISDIQDSMSNVFGSGVCFENPRHKMGIEKKVMKAFHKFVMKNSGTGGGRYRVSFRKN
jgi:hypothetical protein